MLEFVYGHDEEVARFVTTFEPQNGNNFDRCKTIGIIDEEGRLIAGLVYFNYNPDAATIEFGVASIHPRWFNLITYRRMFEYPFIECGCQMLKSYIRADNELLLGMVARMNFDITYLPRWFGRDETGVLCTLTDDQWLDSKIAKRVYRNVSKKREAA